MSHDHNESTELSGGRLLTTMLLNFLITIIEIIGGMFSGSLSLLSDAFHNFSDGIAIIISYTANRLSGKPNSLKYTFGLKRAEIIAAIINSGTLVIISIFLIKGSIDRLLNPSEIKGLLMLIVAAGGLAANVVGTVLLKKGSDKNINLKATYLHLLSDAVSSFAVIVGAVFIIFFKMYWIDSFLTILISLYILIESYRILKEAIDIVMMSVPKELNVKDVAKFIQSFPDIQNVHHIHLWKLNDNDIHFEAHIDVQDMSVSKTAAVRDMLEKALRNKFELTHFTFQFECDSCANPELIKNVIQ